MRGVVLAMTMMSLPAVALAQATGGASGTLLDDGPATATTVDAPAQDAAAPAGVAAPGVNVSQSDATSDAPRATPPVSAAHAGNDSAQSGVAAPGVSVNGAAAQHTAAARSLIEPANALERAFVNAARQESQRAAFRRVFLDSQVALATISADANAAPRLVRLGPAGDACLIFTSDARATQVMGANAPRRMMTGREALERLHGAHLVIININLDPYLTLDADGVEAFLAADAAPTTAPHSAGPAQ